MRARAASLPSLATVGDAAVNPRLDSSLASQTPYFSEERERGSGNTAYRKFSRAKECGASNQIASF